MAKQIKLDGKMFDVLSQGDHNIVIAMDNNRVGKLFELGDPQAQIEDSLLQKANQINGLLVKSLGLQPSQDFTKDVLVMERVSPLQYRALTRNKRKEMLEKFISQVKKLHKSGFAHWDIKRPTNAVKGGDWDNILVTSKGIRLIDVGISVLDDHPKFKEACAHDLESIREWGKIFLAE